MPLLEGKSISQFDAKFSLPSWFVVESEVRPELLRKEVFRIADIVRDAATEVFEGKPLPKTRDDLETAIKAIFQKRGFKLHYEFERLAYREVGSSTHAYPVVTLRPGRARRPSTWKMDQVCQPDRHALKFRLLVSRVESARTPAEEQVAFKLAANWGRTFTK